MRPNNDITRFGLQPYTIFLSSMVTLSQWCWFSAGCAGGARFSSRSLRPAASCPTIFCTVARSAPASRSLRERGAPHVAWCERGHASRRCPIAQDNSHSFIRQSPHPIGRAYESLLGYQNPPAYELLDLDRVFGAIPRLATKVAATATKSACADYPIIFSMFISRGETQVQDDLRDRAACRSGVPWAIQPQPRPAVPPANSG